MTRSRDAAADERISDQIESPRFFGMAYPVFVTLSTMGTLPRPMYVHGAQRLFHAKWARVLGTDRAARAVRQRSAELEAAVSTWPIRCTQFAELVQDVRDEPQIEVTEMLPSPVQSWLPDDAGPTYASTLRLLAADPLSSRAWMGGEETL